MNKLPYFDFLLLALKNGNPTVEKSFGRHVHWGYWKIPNNETPTADDFSQAAENLTQLICSSAHIKNSQSVLDVGCGFGGTIASLNENYQEMNLVGLNIDERQINRAREQVKSIGTNSVDFKQGDACQLPFADNAFDVVLAIECIFHFPSREQFFKEVYRVLKPGGYLALSDFVLIKSFTKGHISNPFFGTCNIDYTSDKYHALATNTQFSIEMTANITKHILPTYRYLKSLLKTGKGLKKVDFFIALTTTSVVEIACRLGLLNYFVFSFKK